MVRNILAKFSTVIFRSCHTHRDSPGTALGQAGDSPGTGREHGVIVTVIVTLSQLGKNVENGLININSVTITVYQCHDHIMSPACPGSVPMMSRAITVK